MAEGRTIRVVRADAALALAAGAELRAEDRREAEEATGRAYAPEVVAACVADSVAAWAALDGAGSPLYVWGASAPAAAWRPGEPWVLWGLGTRRAAGMGRALAALGWRAAALAFEAAGGGVAYNIVPEWYGGARRWLERMGADFGGVSEIRGTAWRHFTLRAENLRVRGGLSWDLRLD